MGLGIQKPELLILPLIAIIVWIAIDIFAFFFMMRLYDRREERRRYGPGYRRPRGGGSAAAPPADPPPVMERVCPWCSGKGRLAAPLVEHFGLKSTTPDGEAPCPRCEATGYVPSDTSDDRKWEALRKKVVKQEWTE